MGKHARLPASGAERWINCPGSVKANEGLPRASSEFAKEGTAAHHLAAICLIQKHDAMMFGGGLIKVKDDAEEDFCERKEQEKLEADGWSIFEVDEEMEVGVQLYLDVCKAIVARLHKTAVVKYETYLDMTWLHASLGGTADFMAAEPFGWLELVDFKYGAGVVVEAKGNKQLKTYAVGALRLFPDCERVRITIVQPRAAHVEGPVREVEYTREELLEFQEELLIAANATELPDAPRNAGDWCKFCGAKAGCETLRERVQVEATMDFDDLPATIPTPGDNDALAKLLDWAPVIESLIRDAEGCALRELEAGRSVGDYKIVRGRANRKWALPDEEIIKMLTEEEGLIHDEATCYQPKKIKSPAQMEKINKKVKAKVADLTYKPEGRVTVVRGSDARPALNRAEGAAIDFDDRPDPLS